MWDLAEPEDVYKALVSELAYTVLPTSVMGLSILVVGTFAFISSGNATLLCATVIGVVASVVKVIVMLRQSRRLAAHAMSRKEAERWERVHAFLTFTVAASVAALGAPMMQVPYSDLKVLATALLFGYAAGVATRVSVRPHIALGAIFIAAVPTTISSALMFDTAHWILAAMFIVFLAAAAQSVWHVYSTTLRQITLRLEMAQHARRDMLTGLSNRLALQERFDKIDRSEDGFLCFHYFDLDGFKAINDRFGHFAGDAVLSTLGERLRHIVSFPSMAARIGGDEFVVYQPNIRDPREAGALAEQIFNACTEPCVISGEQVKIGLSLGYAIAPNYSADATALMRAADAAAYCAKRDGGGVKQDEGVLSKTTLHPNSNSMLRQV